MKHRNVKATHNRRIWKAMKIVWTSIDSHVGLTYATTVETKEMRRQHRGKEWHKETILEYIEVLDTLARSL